MNELDVETAHCYVPRIWWETLRAFLEEAKEEGVKCSALRLLEEILNLMTEFEKCCARNEKVRDERSH